MQRELRENRFGPVLWSGLDPAARGFIATAEQLYRAHRSDAAFDFGTVAVDLAKAAEVQVNALLRQVFACASAEVRRMNLGGTTIDLAETGPFTLGELARAIGDDQERNAWLRRRLVHGEWFAVSLPPILEELAELRNAAAHGEVVARDDVARVRNQLVGVGCVGDLVELARVRVLE
jgi:hypothetical protein